MKRRKAKYLVTVACEVDGTNWKGEPIKLTRTKYKVLPTEAAARSYGEVIAGPWAAKVGTPATVTVAKAKPARKRSNLVGRVPRTRSDGPAVDYAVWLAKRDGIELPDVYGRADWSGVVTDAGFQKRPYRVRFGNVAIELPNWDWLPAPALDLSEPEIEWREAA